MSISEEKHSFYMSVLPKTDVLPWKRLIYIVFQHWTLKNEIIPHNDAIKMINSTTRVPELSTKVWYQLVFTVCDC